MEIWKKMWMGVFSEHSVFRLQRAPECIKTHHLEGEHAKILLDPSPTGEGDTPSPDATPVGASIRIPSRPHFWIRAWRHWALKKYMSGTREFILCNIRMSQRPSGREPICFAAFYWK